MLRHVLALLGVVEVVDSIVGNIAIHPAPQKVVMHGGTVDIWTWTVATDDVPASSTTKLVASLTHSRVASGIGALPLAKFIAVGLLDSLGPKTDVPSSAFATVAAKHGVNVTDTALQNKEGYILQITANAVVLAAQQPVGLFYGYQTLRQLIGETAGGATACHISDWPDFPVRGAYMFGAPHLDDGGLEWNKNLTDWMASHKMNFGVVVGSVFYDIVPSIHSRGNPSAESKNWTLQLQELRDYMQERYVEFVPTLGSGSGGGPEYFNPNTAEGKWVRNASFVFGADGKVAPAAGSTVNNSQLNGDFAQLDPSTSRPVGWTFGASSGPGSPQQWTIVDGDAPPSSKSGRSFRCEMKQISCTSMPSDGHCESEDAKSPQVNITGGSVLQISIWAKLTDLTMHGDGAGNAARGPQITAVPRDANGHSQLYGSINLDPKEAHSYNISEWRQYSFGITTPKNATSVLIYSRLQGANMTATWSLADAEIIQLDNTLRNVIRTNVTDIEVISMDGSKKYSLGDDYEIHNPKTPNSADDCNLTRLDPYEVERIPSGDIPAGDEVMMSYDFLPGKVDVQGHSTPNAFAEPEYYALMDTAISSTARNFPGLKYINFNHDEIRGMARDSRSLRSGLSNAELLAKDMNALQSSVHEHLGHDSRAMFWDDMVNPDHNGGKYDYQKQEGGGRPGKTDIALLNKLIDPSVLWFSWAYGVTPDDGSGRFSDLRKIKDAPQLFASHGYDWVGSPWSEMENVVAWGKALLQAANSRGTVRERHALGLVDTEWGQDLPVEHWGNIPNVSACAWNVAAFVKSAAGDIF